MLVKSIQDNFGKVKNSLSFEFGRPRPSLGAGCWINDDHLVFHVSAGISVYVTTDLLKSSSRRFTNVGLSWDEDAAGHGLWFKFRVYATDDWRSSDAGVSGIISRLKRGAGIDIHFDIIDKILGSVDYEQTGKQCETITISMPERDYSGVIEISNDKWTRKRWPWPIRPFGLSLTRYNAKIDKGIPTIHKGKNNTIYEISGVLSDAKSFAFKSDKVRKSIKHIQETVVRERFEGGGWRSIFQPEKGKSAIPSVVRLLDEDV